MRDRFSRLPACPRFPRFPSVGRFAAVSAVVLALLILASPAIRAHKPITSKYTYNADVFPIFRDRCGRCHVTGGAAPMSLLRYKDAVPWAESIREEIVGEKMPPWYVDPRGAPIKGGHAISSREIDTIITWATGGTPEGDGQPAAREPVVIAREWAAGPPDLVVPMEAEHVVPADVQDEAYEFALATGLASPRFVRLTDLLPGRPDIVRDATIAVENGPVLAAWEPGDRLEPMPAPAAFALPAHARLQVRIHYKKPWQDERKRIADRSSVGLYFAAGGDARRAVQTLSLDAPPGAGGPNQPVALTRTLTAAVSIVSIRPRLDRPYDGLSVDAVLPTGARLSMLRLHRPRPEWPRRYSLAAPIDLPPGTRVEITATPAAPDPDEPSPPAAGSLQIVLELIDR